MLEQEKVGYWFGLHINERAGFPVTWCLDSIEADYYHQTLKGIPGSPMKRQRMGRKKIQNLTEKLLRDQGRKRRLQDDYYAKFI
jgi:hypothetical protein